MSRLVTKGPLIRAAGGSSGLSLEFFCAKPLRLLMGSDVQPSGTTKLKPDASMER